MGTRKKSTHAQRNLPDRRLLRDLLAREAAEALGCTGVWSWIFTAPVLDWDFSQRQEEHTHSTEFSSG